MSRNITIAVVFILLVIAGWYFYKSQKSANYSPSVSQVQQQPAPTQSASSSSASETAMGQNVVKISAVGFTPKDITIKAGESVTWINNDTTMHTVNSNPHPVHTDYPPLNLGLIKPGEQKSLTFPKAGKYGYHDHLNPSLLGTVTVQ